jgi:excinuclease UvrABC nuclease subunit
LSSKVSGVYILHNTTKNIYYVGQAVSLWQRVNNHFIGKGNGDVYADYKYSSNFTITLVRCDIKNLNKVEVFYIHKYNAHLMGYNKTPGNYGI